MNECRSFSTQPSLSVKTRSLSSSQARSWVPSCPPFGPSALPSPLSSALPPLLSATPLPSRPLSLPSACPICFVGVSKIPLTTGRAPLAFCRIGLGSSLCRLTASRGEQTCSFWGRTFLGLDQRLPLPFWVKALGKLSHRQALTLIWALYVHRVVSLPGGPQGRRAGWV